jgi:hypothetical protein
MKKYVLGKTIWEQQTDEFWRETLFYSVQIDDGLTGMGESQLLAMGATLLEEEDPKKPKKFYPFYMSALNSFSSNERFIAEKVNEIMEYLNKKEAT